MPTSKTSRHKGQRSKRVSLADDVPPTVREDGELIPGLRPASIANPGRHPSREIGRRRRSGLTVPALVDPADEPDDTAGRVVFIFGEALVEPDAGTPSSPVVNEEFDTKAEPVGWVPVAAVAAMLVVVFIVGIELLK